MCTQLLPPSLSPQYLHLAQPNISPGLATFLPVCLVTVSNIVFFAITMAKIYSIRKLQSIDALKSKDRQNFLIYIKLSTITGALWLVLILAEALDFDVLKFIAIVTNGLQGVFIFLSYVCNKRVFHLYKERFGQKPSTLTSLDAFPRSRTGQSQQSSTSDKVRDNWISNITTTLEWTVSEKIQIRTTERKDLCFAGIASRRQKNGCYDGRTLFNHF
ncbi:G-protein coupled receptor mth2 [Plakobranchus ocellatus]|uniref:G-protein coupled receptor mth2 n=1 Tax=Plakobranchus ocellatus TaxID=259542 RepID=A0AAV4CIS5_9GAST|nr:G-protein coupled receptor mth2 [Plakobranchus ocellatus]